MDGGQGKASELASTTEVTTDLAETRANILEIIDSLSNSAVVPVRILGIDGPVLDFYIVKRGINREFHLGMKHPSMDTRTAYATQVSNALRLGLSGDQITQAASERGSIQLTEAQFAQLEPRLFGQRVRQAS